MTPEQQRIAIAEACGFKPGTFTIKTCWFDDCVSDGQEKVLFAEHFINGPEVRVPDYLNSLDAMHQAEEVMTDMQRCDYSSHLYDLARKHEEATGKWRFVSMTAAQRAEALLRTLGKWEDAA
jgi:hypothetical protein